MSTERHNKSGESIDRVAQVDRSDLSELVHKSRLYLFKKEALLDPESITAESIESSQILHLSLDEILNTIYYGLMLSKYESRPGPDLYMGYNRIADPNCHASDTTKAFCDNLYWIYNEARLHWDMFKAYYNCYVGGGSRPLEYNPEDDPSETYQYHVYEDADDWFRRYYDDADRLDAGFTPERQVADDGEEWVDWTDVDADAFLQYANDDIPEFTANYFSSHSDQLNYLYGHSVKLINLTAYDQWRVANKLEGLEIDWLLTNDKDKAFFSRHFRWQVFRERFVVCERFKGSWVANMLREAGHMSKKIKSYIYQLEKLVSTSESSILSQSEVDDWVKWYAKCLQWHKTVVSLKDWWQSPQVAEPDSLEAELILITGWQDEVKAKIKDLELLKADVAVSNNRGAKKLPQTPTEAIKVLIEKVQEEKEILDKFNLEVRIEAKYDHKQATENSVRLLEQYWSHLPRKGLAIKKEAEGSSDDLANVSKLEAKIRNYEELPEYKAWYQVVSDDKGQCTRQAIGFQKVMKEGAKDSAFRNAGMRFIAHHKLEPVANFIEVTLESALKDQLRTQGKLKGLTEDQLRGLVRGLEYSVRQEGIENYFFYELQQLGYEFSDIETFRKLAYDQVGKKVATNRTLYDARQVAACLVEEQRENKKLHPKDPPKPKPVKDIVAKINEAMSFE